MELEISFRRGAQIQPDHKDPRRHQERRDFNMVHEDHTQIGNLPRQAQHREFPKAGGFFLPEWD